LDVHEELTQIVQWVAGIFFGGGGILALLKLWFDRRDQARLHAIEDVDRLKERNKVLQARVDTLENDKADLTEENNLLTKKVGLKEIRIAELEARMESLESTVQKMSVSLGLVESSWAEKHPSWEDED